MAASSGSKLVSVIWPTETDLKWRNILSTGLGPYKFTFHVEKHYTKKCVMFIACLFAAVTQKLNFKTVHILMDNGEWTNYRKYT
jgi:hypothetical protein